jgi:hypothetical protein
MIQLLFDIAFDIVLVLFQFLFELSSFYGSEGTNSLHRAFGCARGKETFICTLIESDRGFVGAGFCVIVLSFLGVSFLGRGLVIGCG